MSTLNWIVVSFGLIFSSYQVLKSPRLYFKGLFKAPNDKAKSNSFFLLVLVVVVCSSIVYGLGLGMESVELTTAILVGITLIWKSYEVFRKPKGYFKGLFKKHDSDEWTSVEPLSLWVISVVVLLSYIFGP